MSANRASCSSLAIGVPIRPRSSPTRGSDMQDHDRLNQLRVMRDRLDRLEGSPERDWMLSEVRRRAVDLESEGRAAPLRPLVRESEAELEPAPEPPPVKAPRAGRARRRCRPWSRRGARHRPGLGAAA